MHVKSRATNFLLYQTGWFACVLGAASGRPGAGAVAAGLLVVIHLVLSHHRQLQGVLLLAAAVIGALVETLLIRFGVYRFPAGTVLIGFPPPWILVMWVQFATLLPQCLHWLANRPLLSAGLGFLGGPAAFLGGAQTGAVIFLRPLPHALLLLGTAWAAALPMLTCLTGRLFEQDGPGDPYRIPGRPA